MARVEYEKLSDDTAGESSDKVRERVEKGRIIQRQRFNGSKLSCNNEMGVVEVKKFCKVEPSAQALLKTAMKQLSLSARGFHRILKLSRTIADLEGADIIRINHVAESLQYRPRSLT